MAAATTGMSDALQEEQEELREQLEVALQECAVLKDEVTALTQVSTAAEHRSRGTLLIALAHNGQQQRTSLQHGDQFRKAHEVSATQAAVLGRKFQQAYVVCVSCV